MNIKLHIKKRKNIIISTSIVIICYIIWGIDKLKKGIDLKNSLLDRLASGFVIIVLFAFSLYGGIVLLKWCYKKWPNTTIIVTLFLIVIFIIWAILTSDTKGGGGYWGTYQYDTNF